MKKSPYQRFMRFESRLPKPLRNAQRGHVHNDGSRNMPKMTDSERAQNPKYRAPLKEQRNNRHA